MKAEDYVPAMVKQDKTVTFGCIDLVDIGPRLQTDFGPLITLQMNTCICGGQLASCNVIGYTGNVITGFKHKGSEKFFIKGNKSGIQAKHAKRLRLILGRLNASISARDMNLPGLNLHELSGDRKGTWAVKVSGNWRVMFRFIDKDATEVDYEDYH